MAWFGESLSTLKGQLQHFTKEVLSEGKEEEIDGNALQLSEMQQKVQELEALCASQDLEIAALKQQNAQLRRKIGETNVDLEVADTGGSASTWWTVEQRCDTAYNNGAQNQVANNVGVLEIQEKALKEKDQLVELLQTQLLQIEQEKHKFSTTCTTLEEQLHKLTAQHQQEIVQLQEQLQQAEAYDVSNIKEQLQASQRRVEELEGQLQHVQQQLWEHLSSSQNTASELRSDVEHARWQLLPESGAQRTELLRARQDVVNRIIQMGEKSREVELNMKKLQAEGQSLSSDIVSIIRKLGDPEQQELIHGALNALELENQVLKLQNAQLQKARTLDGQADSDVVENKNGIDRCKESDCKEHGSKYLEERMGKTEDDSEDVSVKSDFSELSLQKQKLEMQVSQLKSQLEIYKGDIKHYEMVKGGWSGEKESMQRHLCELKEQLREKQESLSLVTAQKGLLAVKQMPDNEELQHKVDELSTALCKACEERDTACSEKACLSGELEAMARVIQDLESQLARLQEDKSTLSTSLEELDLQHQDAINQLLVVKKSLQSQNDVLHSEVTALKEKMEMEKKERHVEICHVQSQTETCEEDAVDEDKYEEFRKKYMEEFEEKVQKGINFEIPKECYKRSADIVDALIKLCNEWKWKKDTLERKVAELSKTGRVAEETIVVLEQECNMLRSNVDSLMEELMVHKNGSGEALAPIPESSEEKIAALENEVEVLREARSNLETEANRLREETENCIMKLRSSEAMLRNQENLETEVSKWQEAAKNEHEQLEAALRAKAEVENRLEALSKQVESLESHQEILEETERQHEDCKQQLESAKKEIETLHHTLNNFQENIKDQEKKLEDALHAKSVVEAELEEKKLEDSPEKQALQEIMHEKSALEDSIQELQEKLHSSEMEQKVMQTTVDQWKEVASSAQKKLQETLEANFVLEKQCSRFQENVTSLRESATSMINSQVEELYTINKKQTGEIASLEDLIAEKEKEHSDTLILLKELREKSEAFRLQLSESMEQCKTLVEEKTIIEQKLEALMEEKTYFEEKCTELKNSLLERDKQLIELQGMLHREANCDAVEAELEAVRQEVAHWRCAAEANERQLEEAAEARAELERECGRLFAVETRVHKQEHTERENARLKTILDQTEEQLADKETKIEKLVKDSSRLQSLVSSFSEEISQLRLLVAEKERDLQDAGNGLNELSNNLQSIVEDRNQAQSELNRWKISSESNQHQLEQVLSLQAEIETENKQLHSMVSSFRSQESEMISLQEKFKALELEFQATLNSKSKIEEEYRNLKENLESGHSSTFGKEVFQQDDKDVDDSERNHLSKALKPQSLDSNSQLLALQVQVETLQAERETLVSSLQDRIQENRILKEENEKLSLTIEQESTKAQTLEISPAMKESIHSLIQAKDAEIKSLMEKYNSAVSAMEQEKQSKDVSGTVMKMQKEREELIETIKKKHQESILYHSEVQRLTMVLEQELNKAQAVSEQIQILQQELQDTKNKEEAGRRLLEQQGQEMMMRQMEVENMKEQIDCFQQEAATGCSKKELQKECSHLSESLKQAQARIKYLESEVEERQGKELERLRLHLVTVEESYTRETLKAEEQVKELQSKLQQAEERIKSSSTAYTSASIRANQQVETLQGQARLIAQQRDEVQNKLSMAEDQVQKHAASLRNLQVVLEQFQRDKEREIAAAAQQVYQQVEVAQRKHGELLAEIASLKAQLNEAKEGLGAAARLGEQLEKKTEVINGLKEEISVLSTKLSQAEEKLCSANLNVEGKVDRNLLKNLIMGYFSAPPKSRTEVLRIVATVLNFSKEERGRLGLEPATATDAAKSQSLSEAFVRFLESESRPQPQLRLLPQTRSAQSSRSTTPSPGSSTSTSSQHQPTPLLLSEVQLPTLGQFHIGRNSSSILKDVLKDS